MNAPELAQLASFVPLRPSRPGWVLCDDCGGDGAIAGFDQDGNPCPLLCPTCHPDAVARAEGWSFPDWAWAQILEDRKQAAWDRICDRRDKTGAGR
ncbi:hypothetical protein DT076_16815 [Desertihabitans brevis]|uniref:Uncharacterized protein n=1 Tax=Desertihabitans brevis TaxID=2268447 RepID=A0A367YR57_9ACTN|nr:hypothetical protein [Desertihabitans brevis]RCK68308.1 hypothetical protein DT076_16815 [Desertihabitans brevis]